MTAKCLVFRRYLYEKVAELFRQLLRSHTADYTPNSLGSLKRKIKLNGTEHFTLQSPVSTI